MAPEVITDEPRSIKPPTSFGPYESSTPVMSCCKVRQSSCTRYLKRTVYILTREKVNCAFVTASTLTSLFTPTESILLPKLVVLSTYSVFTEQSTFKWSAFAGGHVTVLLITIETMVPLITCLENVPHYQLP